LLKLLKGGYEHKEIALALARVRKIRKQRLLILHEIGMRKHLLLPNDGIMMAIQTTMA
jgi:hypothetical protein